MSASPAPGVRRALPSPEEIASLPPDGGPDFNRLIHSRSPYLLQHAANPVDWHPWGEEAFALARSEDKPIFLSVGYSTCHWCHVMEHESFEDPDVAALMNETFVCVKVDREERPDIDAVYMEVTVGLTGSGGWPMTVLLTPDLKPFFAGTYFPKTGRFGRPGMMELVPKVAESWRNNRAALVESADEIVAAVRANATRGGSAGPGDAPTTETLAKAWRQFAARYDSRRGGFGSRPKFPTPHNLNFLLRHWSRTGEPRALEMVEKTLVEMRLGGMFDQIGFGFHRYSTDPDWLVPHFEKMLYDQALLALAYVEAFQATGKEFHARVAREIFDYVLRDMTSPEGGFYSAEDADSEGVEGKFYVWTRDEFVATLGPDDGPFFAEIFRIEAAGNFLEESTGHKTGENIPHLAKTFAEHAAARATTEEALRARWETARKKLFDRREGRVHPLKDDKIMTDWNGLMIAALAAGGAAFDDARLIEAAGRAADFVLENLRAAPGEPKAGELFHVHRGTRSELPAHLEDYVYFVWGLLNLYEATFEVRYLRAAFDLTRIQIGKFRDAEAGGFFFAAEGGEELFHRTKEIYDGARPSGNSVAATNLLRLAAISGDPEFEALAEETMRAFGGELEANPSAYAHMMMAADFAIGPSAEVAIAGDPSDGKTRALVAALRKPFLPNKVVLLRPSGDEAAIAALTELAPFVAALKPGEDGALAYVCRNRACERPTADAGEMLKSLGAR